MKKTYAKPLAEIEVYQLNAAIAANCGEVVSLGPEAPGYEVCEEYKDAWEVFALQPRAGGTPFYADGQASCDCYYSSGGGTLFTS